MTKSKCKYVCSECESENVKRDAWAAWDAETQTWEIASVFEAAWCDDCDGKTTLEAIEVVGEG